MFKNLRAEMVRAGFDVSMLANKIGMTAGKLYARLNGTTPFSLDEACTIKKVLGVEMPIEELFRKEVEW